ncbi:MAG TPA: hypothetical protein PK668_00880 [Myxococcota bacterium]|nr:hypothetical protein [Myxococcota bacterium]HRY95614.1 hypothetical protein [Myxococcota bacterium]HSA20129.1 hypothetical protein [Myxococcota bacterium]
MRRPLVLCLCVLPLVAACSGVEEAVISSRAYKGHESDLDMSHFVNAHRHTAGTRLDDCQTCHASATFTYGSGPDVRTVTKNACDHCHLIRWPAEPGFNEPQPTAFSQVLNPYGAAYLVAGRTQAALASILDADSDGDGASNGGEIADLKYPGDPASKPGQRAAPLRTFDLAGLRALAAHEQFQLCNASKQQFDEYVSYRGVKIKDLLAAAGVDTTAAGFTGITVIAPDGYLKDIPAEEINQTYPAGEFHAGLDTATLGPDCGFVRYPGTLPAGVSDGQPVPGEQWLLLAYQRDGGPLDAARLDPSSSKFGGEGPFRLVVPLAKPGSLDRGSQRSPSRCNDGWDYDPAKDHNAGAMVRGVIAIRVNPLPAGVEDFDYRNGGWAYVDAAQLLVYGFGVRAD